VLRCQACGKTTRGEFAEAVRSGVQYGAGVKARVLYLKQYQLLPYQRTSEAMRDLFGCPLSTGTQPNPTTGSMTSRHSLNTEHLRPGSVC
jgi:transposase